CAVGNHSSRPKLRFSVGARARVEPPFENGIERRFMPHGKEDYFTLRLPKVYATPSCVRNLLWPALLRCVRINPRLMRPDQCSPSKKSPPPPSNQVPALSEALWLRAPTWLTLVFK